MKGGLGNDTYTVDNVGDVVIETSTMATEIDKVFSSISYTLKANLENLTLTGTAAINGTGNALNNIITGNVSANTLNGGVGVDKMIGGDGNDIYYVDNVGDVITETNAVLATGGTDTVYAYVNHTLGANVENLRILGTGAINGTGNAFGNVLYAGAGNNILDGGAGLDTAVYKYATAGVTISLASAVAQTTGSSGSDTLLNIESLTGSDFNDSLTGNNLANTLNGGVGADTMIGGDGNDLYYVDNVSEVVTETNTVLATGGTDKVYAYINYTLGANVENLRILATGAVNGTGNALGNVLYAGAGNNILDGGDGFDTASYAYATKGVTVSLASAVAQITGGSGSDTLLNIESLTGSDFNDRLTCNNQANTLNGGVGADTMIGGVGNDIYYVDNAGDVVTETSTLANEIDKVNSSVNYSLTANVENLTLTGTAAINGTGNTSNNVLTGNAGANILNGGAGNDSLIGGLGKDNLTGGLGADKFKFNAVAETGITATTRDIIVDFNHSQGDKIDLSAIDANTALAGNNAFSAPTLGGTFSGVFANPGELYFDQLAHILYGNNDADSAADFSIQLTGVNSLVAADFVL